MEVCESFDNRFTAPMTQIDDLGGIKSPDDLERCKLAALYHMIDMRDWGEGIYNHMTVRHHPKSV